MTANDESRIHSLLSQLEDKITSMDGERTSPEEISSAFSDRIQGYLGGLFNLFTRNKEREENDAKKPRSIVQPAIPIDVVSITPTAAGQIVTALEAAGIGKYNLDIEQKIIEPEDSGGLLSSIISVIGGVIAWTAGFLGSLLASLGAFLAARFALMGGFFSRKFKLIGLALSAVGLLAGLELSGLTDFTDMDDNMFGSAVEGLNKLASDAKSSPDELFSHSPPAILGPATQGESVAQTEQTSMSNLLASPDEGPTYAQNLLRDDHFDIKKESLQYNELKGDFDFIMDGAPVDVDRKAIMEGLQETDDPGNFIKENLPWIAQRRGDASDEDSTAANQKQEMVKKLISDDFMTLEKGSIPSLMAKDIASNKDNDFGDFIANEQNLSEMLSPEGNVAFEEDKETLKKKATTPPLEKTFIKITETDDVEAGPMSSLHPSGQATLTSTDVNRLAQRVKEATDMEEELTAMVTTFSSALHDLNNQIPHSETGIPGHKSSDEDLPQWDTGRKQYLEVNT